MIWLHGWNGGGKEIIPSRDREISFEKFPWRTGRRGQVHNINFIPPQCELLGREVDGMGLLQIACNGGLMLVVKIQC